jgi:DHA1 family bicyclomycin/chloramphenicol resistance-like MFS transporter
MSISTPSAPIVWRGPRWTLALLLASLATLGPFSIDTYLPAFGGIAASIGATPVQLQQTLSGYLLGFALMNLFHGALSDSLGRRPVIVAGMGLFALASAGCALAGDIGTLIAFRVLQGMCAGAGMVIGRAVIRDLFEPIAAMKLNAQVTLFFGVAPAIAPLIGGWLFVLAGWHSIFWFLTAIGAVLAFVSWRWLPESLPVEKRQPLHLGSLLRGYAGLVRNPRFLALVAASSVPFNGMFIYVLSAPVFAGELLGLAPTQFFWLFVATIAGIMAGAQVAGRLAGRVRLRTQVRVAFAVMALACAANVAIHLVLPPNPWWSIPPVALYAFGWSVMTPVAMMLVLDQAPDRRGMAASVQASLGSAFNAVVAGMLAPLVMHSTLRLALAAMVMMVLGLLAWSWVKRRIVLPGPQGS